MTKTPNLNLNVPDYGDQNWNVPVNENWSLLDTAIAGKQNTLTFDSTPTNGSSNPVTSVGIYTALSAKANDSAVVKLTGDQTITGIKTLQNTSLAVKSTVTDDEASSISGNIEYGMLIQDKNGSRIGNFYGGQRSNGKIRTYMCACRPVDGTMAYKYAEIQQSTDGTAHFNINCDTTQAPTPATSDNSTKIATTAYVVNVLKAIYPVGAVYIGTTSTCPLASFFGTWTLKSSGIVTSVNTNVPIKGNGKTLGLTDSVVNLSMFSIDYDKAPLSSTGYGENVGYTTRTSSHNSKAVGVTTDPTKSGIVGTVTRSTLSVNIWERTA